VRLVRRARRSLAPGESSRVVSILGMHRSGTSSLAGSLEEAGLFLGQVGEGGRWNRKGNRESKVLMQLHEDVLKANGGAWHKPPQHVAWGDEHKHRRDRFIERRAARPIWGFKDPRAILVIDGWLDAIPALEMVATVRHPMAVARSLQRRSGSRSIDQWLELWLAYNERLLRLHETHGFPILDFDLPAEQYQAQVAELIAQLGLRTSVPDEFFEDSLRNQPPFEAELPPSVEQVYRELTTIAAARSASNEEDAHV
jgi:hypothetical protein